MKRKKLGQRSRQSKGSSHYSYALTPDMLGSWASRKADAFYKYHERRKEEIKYGRPVLCYTGLSGIALATALSLELVRKYPRFKFDMVNVRKPGDKNHGHAIECTNASLDDGDYLVFVDDFIDEGKTLRRMKRVLSKFYSQDLLFTAVCLGRNPYSGRLNDPDIARALRVK